jgi:hypothetical protein
MKKSVVAVLSSCAVLAFAVASNADLIKITGITPGSAERVSITGSSLAMGGPDFNGWAGTGLYTAVNLTTNQTWLTYCIDPVGEIDIGYEWNADLVTSSQLATGTAGILSQPAYGATAAVTIEKYQMIGYLANKYYYDLTAANPMANSNNTSTAIDKRSDLSLAFWEIARDYNGTQASLNLSGNNFKAYGSLTFAQGLLGEAYDNRTSNINNLTVYTPTTRPSQEFIAISVPEPGSFILLGTGLLSLLGMMVVRRKK